MRGRRSRVPCGRPDPHDAGKRAAPHENSFRRLLPGAHAPSSVAWGYENRTVAVRIPGGDPKARRIEHRVAGADANPYLVLASTPGGAFLGIENGGSRHPRFRATPYSQNLKPCRPTGPGHRGVFARGDMCPKSMPAACNACSQCKVQELRRFTRHVTEFEYHSYLEAV